MNIFLLIFIFTTVFNKTFNNMYYLGYGGSRGSITGMDSDMEESLSQPFPPVPAPDSSLGSPYENVRPSSRHGRSLTAESVSPGTSPSRWECYRQSRSVDGCEDRRVSGTSAMSM